MGQTPEDVAREFVDLCANCNFCRDLLADTPCMVFPKLYRMHDDEAAGKRTISSKELQSLVTLCNMCGSCPCPSVRAKIRQARDGFLTREGGLTLSLRVLNNVRLVGHLGGMFPRLSNYLAHTRPWASLIKRLAGIHPERKVPRFPPHGFDSWAKPRGYAARKSAPGRKVAYFVGCSAKYLFPDVAKATVEVLERNGVTVHIPEQRCCGMPAMMEGDSRSAFDNVHFNMAQLLDCVDAGYDLLFSCPTCCYMHKSVLRDGAHFSAEYRAVLQEELEKEGGDVRQLARAIQHDQAGKRHCGPPHSQTPMALKLVIRGLCRDEGYFASLNGLDRMRLADSCYDLGEYLRSLQQAGEFNDHLGPVPDSMAYYAPCHVKEQDMGRPWLDVLSAVPGLAMPEVGDLFDCCGSSGVRGFQQKFHKLSLVQGKPLIEKMRAANPDRIATDCLSCRMQFNQALPTPVSHPVEILLAAYRSHDDATTAPCPPSAGATDAAVRKRSCILMAAARGRGAEEISDMHVQDRPPARPAMEDDADDELLERMKTTDDEGAFRVLVERHVDTAYGLAMRILRNAASAEDVTQDAMIKAWTHRHAWEPGRAKFSTWLYRVVVNRCADLGRRPGTANIDDVPEPADDQPDATTTIYRRQVFGQLEQAMAELPEQQRLALSLTYFDHQGNADVAEIMGTTVMAVESLLKRGRNALRARLHPVGIDLALVAE